MPDSSDASPPQPIETEGLVVRSTGSWYEVQTDDGPIIPSRMRGKFRLEEQTTTNPVAVGDRVTIRVDREDDEDIGFIVDIHERRNHLVRRAAGRKAWMQHAIVANVDHAWCVQAVRMPKFNPGFVDRFLVMAEAYDIPPGLIVNKVDLLRKKDREQTQFFLDLYASLGYPVVATSGETGRGVEGLREAFAGGINVVVGPSGAGKSTLLNAIEPDLGLRTAAVSEKTSKGKHTTTNAELHPLSGGGYVADTPGIREFGVVTLEPYELGHHFVEFRPHIHDCKFPNCSHDHEPGCAVKEAVDEGTITEERYGSYLSILWSLEEGQLS